MQLSTAVNTTMTSREIAELTGKRHSDVKRDIEVMMIQLQEDVSKFARIYLDAMNRQQTEYALDREHTECLVTGYNAMLRMKVIKRLHELEEGSRAQLPDFNNPAIAARAWADQVEQRQQLESQLAIAAPKAQFVDSYVNASGSLRFRETCKLLHIKENAFRHFLLDSEIMYLLAGKLTPYAQHIDAGRFTVKTGENQNNGHAFTQNKFTPKGIQWIAGLWAARQVQERAA
ncbi:phage antirepressor KilAC domain-containing protein [Pantoea sp. B9002]|uniref:phage antirepressor KilAC domain-containing protein n=1 Tax=Pantoea sp. B9002 TaxID=2726979 RepID=UPI0015A29A13|nr:phage antirepressor KilAC domain-containing protein [Pantoea sp. B9002]NWA63008.1 phage antirepressor KilAC domain-containing protein [Pantoea sp. B9002]